MKNKPNPELIDETNPEWTEKMFNEALPASQILPELLKSYNENTQISTTISFDAKVLEFFKSQSKDWQMHINEVLKNYIASH